MKVLVGSSVGRANKRTKQIRRKNYELDRDFNQDFGFFQRGHNTSDCGVFRGHTGLGCNNMVKE